VAGPSITGFVLPGTTKRWDMAEFRFDVSGAYSNVFDPSVIQVDATITSPQGVVTTQPCFWAQKYTAGAPTSGHGEIYNISGSPHWYLRYKFPYEGIWSAAISATNSGGTTVSASQQVMIAGARADKLSPWRIANTLYFTWDDGTWFSPIGEDVAVEDRDYHLDGTVGYAKYLANVGGNGGLIARFLLSAYHRNGPEYLSTAAMYSSFDNFGLGLGQYAQQNCFRIDEFLRIAALNGVSVLLAYNTHGEFSTSSDPRWGDSPYSDASTPPGPIAALDPAGLFTNATALKYQKMKARYMIARWAPSPALGAIEHMNEGGSVGTGFFVGLNNLDGNGASVNQAAWVQTMGTYIRSIDPWSHLMTWSEEWDPSVGQETQTSPVRKTDSIWNLSTIDFTTAHVYQNSPWVINDRRHTALDMLHNMQIRIGKPALHTESGLYRTPSAPEPSFDPTTSSLGSIKIDHLLAGTHVTSVILADIAGGFLGGWEWWHGSYLTEDSGKHRVSGTLPFSGTLSGTDTWSFPLEPLYAPAAAICVGENPTLWPVVGGPLTVTVGAGLSAVAWGYSQRALIYINDTANNYGGSEPGNLVARSFPATTLTVAGLVDGAHAVEIWGTRGAGGLLQTLAAQSLGGSLSVQLPTIDRDMFVKVYPVGVTYVYDSGSRSVAAGLGSADVGGAWTIGGTAADFNVNGSQVVLIGSASGVTRRAFLPGVIWQNQDVRAKIQTDKVPTGASQANYLMLRAQDLTNDFYRVIFSFTATNAITISIEKVVAGVNTIVANTVTPGRDAYTTNTEFWCRAQAEDGNPTILRAKIWKAGTIEPAAWDLVGTDASAPLLQGAGAIGIRNYVGAATNTPVTFKWDEIQGTEIANPNAGGPTARRLVRQARNRASSF